MQTRLAIFRVDAGRSIGLGHLTRCIALAEALTARGWSCRFAVTGATLDWVEGGFLAEHAASRVPPGADAGIVTLRQEFPDGCRLLVVDSYDLDAAFECTAREWATSILAIDDRPDRDHDCDYLLDHTLGRTRSEYAGRIPDACVTFLGAAFALLRREFAEWRPRSVGRNRTACRRLLVSFGGADQDMLTARVVQLLRPLPPGVSADVVINGAHRADATAAATGSLGADSRLWINPVNMAELMSGADLAIGAGGVTSWERCCMGLPAVIVVLADNQRNNAEAAYAAGAACCVSPQFNWSQFWSLADSLDLSRMSQAAASLCDGRGSLRVATELGGPVPSSAVSLRPANAQDIRFFWQVNNRPDVRDNSLTQSDIPWADHQRWYETKISDASSRISIVDVSGNAAGVVRLEAAESHTTVSIALMPRWRGCGIGRVAIRHAVSLSRSTFGEKPVIALVRRHNEGSRRAFEEAGFTVELERSDDLLEMRSRA